MVTKEKVTRNRLSDTITMVTQEGAKLEDLEATAGQDETHLLQHCVDSSGGSPPPPPPAGGGGRSARGAKLETSTVPVMEHRPVGRMDPTTIEQMTTTILERCESLPPRLLGKTRIYASEATKRILKQCWALHGVGTTPPNRMPRSSTCHSFGGGGEVGGDSFRTSGIGFRGGWGGCGGADLMSPDRTAGPLISRRDKVYVRTTTMLECASVLRSRFPEEVIVALNFASGPNVSGGFLDRMQGSYDLLMLCFTKVFVTANDPGSPVAMSPSWCIPAQPVLRVEQLLIFEVF
jgi:hypothetical protein